MECYFHPRNLMYPELVCYLRISRSSSLNSLAVVLSRKDYFLLMTGCSTRVVFAYSTIEMKSQQIH